MRRLVLAFAGLALLWLVEVLLAIAGFGAVAPLLGLAMAAIVAVFFMHLGTTVPLGRVFAAAGLFWLVILLGLGAMDPFTRIDYPVPPTGQAGTSFGR